MAKVSVVITDLREPCGYHHTTMVTMSDDLPADNLGEVLARAVHTAWKHGLDPVTDMCVSVHFR